MEIETTTFGTITIDGKTYEPPEADSYFAKKDCKVLLQPTPGAIHVFNRSHAKKIGLFHVTC
jgi:hypothetical protein